MANTKGISLFLIATTLEYPVDFPTSVWKVRASSALQQITRKLRTLAFLLRLFKNNSSAIEKQTQNIKEEDCKMALCETCGNDYDKAFEIKLQGKSHIFDSFECAINSLAPQCAHCGC